jgi:signal transduction histidine kinase
MHDSVTQSVFSVGLLARTARTLYEQRSDALGPTLVRIDAIAQDALGELRALLYELRPAGPLDEGLAQALARLVATMQLRTETPIRFSGACAVRLEPETETAIVRIVQEALANAIKHARATELSVTLVQAPGRLMVTVADDGFGFDPASPGAASVDVHRGGMGLYSMRERAADAGLRLHVRSAPGEGTRVTVEAPLV